jgi:hypothetical protein
MATLFWSLAALFVVLLALLLVADHRVANAGSWESIDRWLLAGSYAAPAAYITLGAIIGVCLAWWVS